MSDITLTVNGRSHGLDVDPDTPLLYVLSDELELNGPKLGCGLAQCGSCTVLVDGEAVRSCVVPVSRFERAAITTLEGLGTPESPHPIQQAFVDEFAVQCGYCIPGFLVAGATLLEEIDDPTDDEIRLGLAGNLCRCTGYYPIVRAVEIAGVDP